MRHRHQSRQVEVEGLLGALVVARLLGGEPLQFPVLLLQALVVRARPTQLRMACEGAFQGFARRRAVEPAVAEPLGKIARPPKQTVRDARCYPRAPCELVPGLATDLPTQVDETTWEFTLREGVTFHNGEPSVRVW